MNMALENFLQFLRDQNIVSAGLNTQSQIINHSIDTIFKDIAGIEVYQESNVQPQ